LIGQSPRQGGEELLGLVDQLRFDGPEREVELIALALRRSDHDAARARYEAALPLFRRVGDVLGEANCIQRLGEIALARFDHEAARARYEEALRLYGADSGAVLDREVSSPACSDRPGRGRPPQARAGRPRRVDEHSP
jgi:tetratricopeptide (TPR) repeat protein